MTPRPQYDAIGSKYAVFKTLPTSLVEEENVRRAVQPHLSRSPSRARARVLDLACGTGYYSQSAIGWGAGHVLGVDISGGMVDVARALAASSQDERCAGGRVRFVVGDALGLGRLKGEEEQEEPFDVVIGAWLLNYAGSLEEMTRMFESVSANLKEGGVFVGLTPQPAEDVDVVARRWMEGQSGFPESFPIRVEYFERLGSGLGWKTEVSNTCGGEKVTFRNFHLRRDVYEEGARRGGLGGSLTWPEVVIPDEARASLGDDVWEMYVRGGRHMGILVVGK